MTKPVPCPLPRGRARSPEGATGSSPDDIATTLTTAGPSVRASLMNDWMLIGALAGSPPRPPSLHSGSSAAAGVRDLRRPGAARRALLEVRPEHAPFDHVGLHRALGLPVIAGIERALQDEECAGGADEQDQEPQRGGGHQRSLICASSL